MLTFWFLPRRAVDLVPGLPDHVVKLRRGVGRYAWLLATQARVARFVARRSG